MGTDGHGCSSREPQGKMRTRAGVPENTGHDLHPRIKINVLSYPGPGAGTRKEKQVDFPQEANPSPCREAGPLCGSGVSDGWQLGSLHQTEAPEPGHSLQLSGCGLSQEGHRVPTKEGSSEKSFYIFLRAPSFKVIGWKTTQLCLTPKLRFFQFSVLWLVGKHWGYLQGSHQVQGGLFLQSLQESPERSRRDMEVSTQGCSLALNHTPRGRKDNV